MLEIFFYLAVFKAYFCKNHFFFIAQNHLKNQIVQYNFSSNIQEKKKKKKNGKHIFTLRYPDLASVIVLRSRFQSRPTHHVFCKQIEISRDCPIWNLPLSCQESKTSGDGAARMSAKWKGSSNLSEGKQKYFNFCFLKSTYQQYLIAVPVLLEDLSEPFLPGVTHQQVEILNCMSRTIVLTISHVKCFL